MTFTILYLVAGGVLVLMALGGTVLGRLPLTTSMLYLAIGVLLGPAALGVLTVDPLARAAILERVSEVVVIVSLFTAGLKLRSPLAHDRWRAPVLLATLSMALTVLGVAAAGVAVLGLSAGAAILLGAILAPTDPVLASDVQTEHPHDTDRLRFSLTGEAGLNDGTAFPFVLLGLGLLGFHDLGDAWWRWIALDVVWAVAAGIATGLALGTAVGRLVVYLRSHHREAVGLDEFLALGLIALSYGIALVIGGLGFLAVFAAGVALRRVERVGSGDDPDEDVREIARVGRHDEVATSPEHAPAYMAQAVLGFNEQLDRIGEVVVVVLVGMMLSASRLSWDALWFVPLLFLLIRPLSVAVGLAGSRTVPHQRRLVAWFGIRGIGSVFYLAFALTHGLDGGLADDLTALVLTTVAASVVVHGVSVTPLMRRYEARQRRHGGGRRTAVP